jgi:hypothetical protein
MILFPSITAKSAYRLAKTLYNEQSNANSIAPKGERILWKNIWTTLGPNKVRIFSWCLVCDNLPTQQNKWRRRLELQSTCHICDIETEDSLHAAFQRTKARALRSRMREDWNLPNEEFFSKTPRLQPTPSIVWHLCAWCFAYKFRCCTRFWKEKATACKVYIFPHIWDSIIYHHLEKTNERGIRAVGPWCIYIRSNHQAQAHCPKEASRLRL